MLADGCHVLSLANERGRDKIDTLLAPKGEIALVPLRQSGKIDLSTGKVDSLGRSQRSRVLDLARHGGLVLADNRELDEAVVNEDRAAHFNELGEGGVAVSNLGVVAEQVEVVNKLDLLPGSKRQVLAVLVLGRANLGPLGVEKDRTHALRAHKVFAKVGDSLSVILVVAVREVHARNVHTRRHEPAKHLHRLRVGADGADKLCGHGATSGIKGALVLERDVDVVLDRSPRASTPHAKAGGNLVVVDVVCEVLHRGTRRGALEHGSCHARGTAQACLTPQASRRGVELHPHGGEGGSLSHGNEA
mmetsp:Transcript_7441/g.14481  ORF Transcript_7441/g.14481 Transcript_7441/m.14481 type:complete len:304 (+) Transcript_7441:996-1907(+)